MQRASWTDRTIVECKLFNTVPEDEEIRDKIIPDILSISGNSVDTEYIEMIFQSDWNFVNLQKIWQGIALPVWNIEENRWRENPSADYIT